MLLFDHLFKSPTRILHPDESVRKDGFASAVGRTTVPGATWLRDDFKVKS
jgi:hypothetical protein